MEALRYLPWLAEDGWIITNNEPFVNIANYPDMEKVNAELAKVKNVVSFNANEIAKAIKARSNMVLLGATVPYLGIELGKVEEAINHIFGNKGAEVVEVNMQALHAGYEQAKK